MIKANKVALNYGLMVIIKSLTNLALVLRSGLPRDFCIAIDIGSIFEMQINYVSKLQDLETTCQVRF